LLRLALRGREKQKLVSLAFGPVVANGWKMLFCSFEQFAGKLLDHKLLLFSPVVASRWKMLF
jgi:hypothetical protein